ncbi:MAG TPA: IS1182 family transposase [Candidatus Dormibacteraeota bacterium]|jgi:transposase
MKGTRKTFRPYTPDQILLLPPDLSEWVPARHLARLVDDLVENTLDLEPIYSAYIEVRGAPPYDPRLLLKILLYGYSNGIFSSRRLERATIEHVPFRFLSANQTPDYWTISNFRKVHLVALKGMFKQVLELCQEVGIVKLGHVAIDGTKIKANASKHKAMSYGGIKERQPRYEEIAAEWLKRAEEIDEAEDAEFGDGRGDELPEELQRAETRIARLKEAKAAIEKRAKDEGRKEPANRDQYNFTDPESRIMLGGDKAFVQGYNCQLAVDDTPHHVIVAAEVSNQAADNPHLLNMVVATALNTDAVPGKISADAGYGSESNITTMDALKIDAYLAQAKAKHTDRNTSCPRGRIPDSATPRQRMARKNRTKKGRALYARRKHVVEPAFGIIKQAMGFRQFLLRGRVKVDMEWSLVSAAYNLCRLHESGRWRTAPAA